MSKTKKEQTTTSTTKSDYSIYIQEMLNIEDVDQLRNFWWEAMVGLLTGQADFTYDQKENLVYREFPQVGLKALIERKGDSKIQVSYIGINPVQRSFLGIPLPGKTIPSYKKKVYNLSETDFLFRDELLTRDLLPIIATMREKVLVVKKKENAKESKKAKKTAKKGSKVQPDLAADAV